MATLRERLDKQVGKLARHIQILRCELVTAESERSLLQSRLEEMDEEIRLLIDVLEELYGAREYDEFRECVKYVSTTDDWHPNYQGDMVRVTCGWRSAGNHTYLHVWGGDDVGMEIFWDGNKWEEAKSLFDRIKGPVTFASLEKMGLRRA